MLRPVFLALVAFATALVSLDAHPAVAAAGGKLRLEVVDRDTQKPLACRMHLTNAAGRALKAPKVPFWHDHFVFSGDITLKLPLGDYTFEIERGPEYLIRTGRFTIEPGSDDTKVADLKRVVDMAAEGWWSGDLDVSRPAKDIELLMLADDLHVAELVTWPHGQSLLSTTGAADPLVRFDGNRYYHLSAGIDSRAGGTLLFFNLKQPLDMADFKPEFPPQHDSIAAAKARGGGWVDAQKAYGWDLPLWVALGDVDSIQLANSNLARKSAVDSEAGGKPRDRTFYPGAEGNGRWSEKIYYQLLNCGLRIVPTAGSGSGSAPNPVGYNRVYVHVEGDFTYEKWWDALRQGRCVVTNGPLIRPTVEGEMPGHVFRADAGREIELEVGLTLSTRDRVSYLEIIKNGELAQQVRLDEWAKLGGKLPPLVFKESGWFVIRAVTSVPETYRFATTAPYYVEIGYQPRISKAAAQFFLDWVTQRVKNLKLDNAAEREAVLKYHRQARDFWRGLVEKANAP
jgi:hypothetical protein